MTRKEPMPVTDTPSRRAGASHTTRTATRPGAARRASPTSPAESRLGLVGLTRSSQRGGVARVGRRSSATRHCTTRRLRTGMTMRVNRTAGCEEERLIPTACGLSLRLERIVLRWCPSGHVAVPSLFPQPHLRWTSYSLLRAHDEVEDIAARCRFCRSRNHHCVVSVKSFASTGDRNINGERCRLLPSSRTRPLHGLEATGP